jgi:hypothetical protein
MNKCYPRWQRGGQGFDPPRLHPWTSSSRSLGRYSHEACPRESGERESAVTKKPVHGKTPRLATGPDACSLNLVARLTAPPLIQAGEFAPWPATLYLALTGNAKSAERRTAMSIPIGLLLLCVAMALAVGGLLVVQRLVPIAVRRQHNDEAGFIYAVLGVTYAVLLGLMVVAVWRNGTRPR